MMNCFWVEREDDFVEVDLGSIPCCFLSLMTYAACHPKLTPVC